MGKENLSRGLISFVTIIPFLLFSCITEGKELNRKKAEEILTNHLQQQISWLNGYMCKLTDVLTNKPEFIQLKNIYFCSLKPTVTGIRKISENTAIVEYKMESIYDKKSLKKILDASEKLQTRYATLKPVNKRQITEGERIAGDNNFAMSESRLNFYFSIKSDFSRRHAWEFKDPVDGSVFFSYVADDEVGDIKKTSVWRVLEYINKVCRDYTVNNIGNHLGNDEAFLHFMITGGV